MEPLEAVALHPPRCLRQTAGDQVERGADPDEHRRMESGAVLGHPALLLGCSQADPDDVWGGGVDLRHEGGILLGAERPERWAGVAGHDQIRILATQTVEQALNRSGGTAEEVV